ncbi:MAG: hypothetical protein JO165_06060, partial [Candidatus Eremiobacteraeota bacterium]|nr:hypothetical protein [Candidatus Eremiobacteraeota bacterium]
NIDGLSRVTPSGTFTSFPFTLAQNSESAVSEMIPAADGAVWVGLGSAESGCCTGIARIDDAGNFSNVASLSNRPVNLTLGKDNNLWFSTGTNVDSMTSAGAVTTYTLPGASPNQNPLRFTIGPDGNFWAPFPYGASTLLKFSTSGSVVSNGALTYTAPWDSYYSTISPLIPQGFHYVKDASGNIYTTDSNAQAVLRIKPSGQASAYPTYSSTINRVQDPMELCIGADGKLYLFSYQILSISQNGELALTPIDLSAW